jgi:taurine dioxygenase
MRLWRTACVESDALLAMLHSHCQRPEYQVRVRWKRDTIAMWDNHYTQHKVVADHLDALRKMERITLRGGTPR